MDVQFKVFDIVFPTHDFVNLNKNDIGYIISIIEGLAQVYFSDKGTIELCSIFDIVKIEIQNEEE